MLKTRVEDVSNTIVPIKKKGFGAIVIIILVLLILIATILGITLGCKYILKKIINIHVSVHTMVKLNTPKTNNL